jgi:hypothetical protein
VEAVDPAVEIADETAGELRVRFPVLVIEGMPTSDGRLIEPGALTPRALPLSLLAQAEASHGGDDPGPAVVIGRLDSMERRPGPEVTSRRTGEPFPEGTFVWSAEGVIDANHPVADLVRRGFLRGVSVDLAGMDYEIVGDDGAPMADGDWGSGGRLITHAAELAAATLVPVPAFGDAYGELADDPEPLVPVAPEDLPEGLLASAVPAWRSPEVGDLVAVVAAATSGSYVEQMRDRIVEVLGADEIEGWGENAERLLDLYTLLALTRGADVTPEDAHDVWSVAISRTDPTHRSLIPFDELAPDVQAMDDKYRDAIVTAATAPGEGGAAITAAADEGMPVRIPPDSVEQLTAVIDTGAERDATDLATAIVEHIAQQWALDEPVTEDELPADEAVVAAASEEQGGFPEDPQPCSVGDEPAVESIVFRDGSAYAAVCAEHRQQVLDELAAAGEVVDEIVPIGAAEEGAPVEPVVAAAGEPHTGGMIALIPADPSALVVDGGDPAEDLHLTLAYLGDDVTGMDEEVRAALLADVEAQAATLPPVEAEVMGHAAFNPTGANDREPCAVYLVSGPGLPDVKAAFAAHDVGDHPVFLPHITAAYGLEPSALNFVGPVVFDRFRVALGEDVHDFPLGAPAEVEDEPAAQPDEIVAAVSATPVSLDPARPTLDQETSVTAAAAVRPPADWFTDPQLDGPTALRVTEDGRVYGHAALWDTVHIGQPNARIRPPRSTTGYAYYRTGAVLCDDGSEVAVGPITIDCGHAGTDLGRMATVRHYDDVGTAVADAAVGEDEHGIWVAGALRATVDEVTAARLRASSLSGDWRRVGSSLELCALLAVNVPGFPIPRARVASGEPMALVAAGALRPEETPESAGTATFDYDTLAEALASRLDARREAGELSARHAALVSELDDTPAVVAALLAEVDDSPHRAAELFAELDNESFLSGMPPQLKAEWLAGAIAARIAYGTPGQFERCQAIAREKGAPGQQIDGMCADLIREATGREPGDHG